jgi:hypothetical protein
MGDSEPGVETSKSRGGAVLVAAIVAVVVLVGGVAWKVQHDRAREQCQVTNNLRSALGSGTRDC